MSARQELREMLNELPAPLVGLLVVFLGFASCALLTVWKFVAFLVLASLTVTVLGVLVKWGLTRLLREK